ncbi:MAG TPA: hypothetical protein VHB02_01085 [Acidimicrobiales bacterium]|nr:hypothetical protein [Acidimicrobiales bacterium]
MAPLVTRDTKLSRNEHEQWRDAIAWQPPEETGLVIRDDLSSASWIGPLLDPGSYEVGMTAPGGFDAYARICFPFVAGRITADGQAFEEHMTWREVANRNGRIAHALMEKEAIQRTGSEAVRCSGSLAPEQLGALLPILFRHTQSSFGWFLLWEGWGDLAPGIFSEARPRISHPTRNHFLLRGPLHAYRSLPHDPNYCWPDDRAWCLCTDTDLDWAYIAGSVALVDEIISIRTMDAFETQPHDPARLGMDVVNDPDGTVSRP